MKNYYYYLAITFLLIIIIALFNRCNTEDPFSQKQSPQIFVASNY